MKKKQLNICICLFIYGKQKKYWEKETLSNLLFCVPCSYLVSDSYKAKPKIPFVIFCKPIFTDL